MTPYGILCTSSVQSYSAAAGDTSKVRYYDIDRRFLDAPFPQSTWLHFLYPVPSFLVFALEVVGLGF